MPLIGVPVNQFILMNTLMFFIIKSQFRKRDEAYDKYFAHLSDHHLNNFEYYKSMKQPYIYKLYI